MSGFEFIMGTSLGMNFNLVPLLISYLCDFVYTVQANAHSSERLLKWPKKKPEGGENSFNSKHTLKKKFK